MKRVPGQRRGIKELTPSRIVNRCLEKPAEDTLRRLQYQHPDEKYDLKSRGKPGKRKKRWRSSQTAQQSDKKKELEQGKKGLGNSNPIRGTFQASKRKAVRRKPNEGHRTKQRATKPGGNEKKRILIWKG